MSTEQLDRIERRLDQLDELVVGQRELRNDVAALTTDVGGLKTDVASLKTDVGGLRTDVEGLKVEVVNLRADMDTNDQRLRDELIHRMDFLQEHTKAAIRDLAPDFAPIQREFTAADAALREDILRRLEPLEAEARSRQSKHAG